MSDAPPPPATIPSPFKRFATLFKMVGIAALGLLLLTPLGLVAKVLQERLARRDATVAEITRTWGRDQQIVGPVLAIPYPHVDGSSFFLLPETLAIQADLRPEVRRRGIYQAVVWRGTIALEGTFTPSEADAARLHVAVKELAWDDAWVSLAIPDLRGVEGPLAIAWAEEKVPLLPGSRLSQRTAGVHAPVKVIPGKPIHFQVHLTLNGSEGLRFAPLGADNRVIVRSPWRSPSFQGSVLPVRRAVSAAGFEAEWRVSQYANDLGRVWTQEPPPGQIEAAAFGVDLFVPLDAYRNVERAIKYGVLFIALVFMVFFLFETRSGVRIHPFQYALVGLAVALFFLVLLAVSEFVPFPTAYAAAAGSCTLMISLYSLSVLRTQRRTLVAAAGLASAFGFLYVTLQLEDYALLFGATGLLAGLAIVMFVTRRIDWYARDAAPIIRS